MDELTTIYKSMLHPMAKCAWVVFPSQLTGEQDEDSNRLQNQALKCIFCPFLSGGRWDPWQGSRPREKEREEDYIAWQVCLQMFSQTKVPTMVPLTERMRWEQGKIMKNEGKIKLAGKDYLIYQFFLLQKKIEWESRQILWHKKCTRNAQYSKSKIWTKVYTKKGRNIWGIPCVLVQVT